MTFKTIKEQIDKAPNNSGVYQFLDEKDQVLYVGKAKNLIKRLKNYTQLSGLSARISRMVFLAKRIEIIQTETEVDALLLEHNLIKKFYPRYNILLKDDKTFPHIKISNHQFPQISKHRGSKAGDGIYFGPFASNLDVNRVIEVLRKSFLIRNCTDKEFKNRKNPCLEYQIKRCTAPCVSLIEKSEYQASIKNAVNFLDGKSAEVQKNLEQKMLSFSEVQEYEKAAVIRDQIKSLNSIQTKQNINIARLNNCDVITLVIRGDEACCYISFFRNGQNYGAKPYFFSASDLRNVDDFLGQFYLTQLPPELILLNVEAEEKDNMEEFLSRIAGKKVTIESPKQGYKDALIKGQEQIAVQNLEQKLLQNLNNQKLLLEVKKVFDLDRVPKRIEVYDNSHTANTNAIGALITAGVDGFIKSGYRKFNIGKHDNITAKDDTAMLREVLTRRFSKLKQADFPDFIIIDGGKPQLSATQEVFDLLNIKIPFVCMAKGENRNAGEEKFYQTNKEFITLPKTHPTLYYLQRLRDEAHRFAIMTHKKRREKSFIAN